MKSFFYLIFIIIIFFSCEKNSTGLEKNEPVENKWEDITGNIEGNTFTKMLIHQGDLYVSSKTKVFRYIKENNNWQPITPEFEVLGFIRDFMFNNDTLIILSSWGVVYKLNDSNQWEEIYNTGREWGESNLLIKYNNELYVGSDNMHGFGNEALKFGLFNLNKGKVIKFKLTPWITYDVNIATIHKNSLYIGNSFAGSFYSVAKLVDSALIDVEIGTNEKDVYSFYSAGDTLYIGMDDRVKYLVEDIWHDCTDSILPAPEDFIKFNQAYSLLKYNDKLLIGTRFMGILYWENGSNKYLSFNNNGLPFYLENGKQWFYSVVSILNDTNDIYAGISIEDFDIVNPPFNRIYKFNITP